MPLLVALPDTPRTIDFTVRITGKHLTKAVILPMQIIVGEPPVAEASPEA